MIVFHPKPFSYTGEDLTEISCHGNPLIVAEIMDVIKGTYLARLAERGEFTKRAYINSKIDLTQAEAIGALIASKSLSGLEMARNTLGGKLSKKLKNISGELNQLLADIEASFITDREISESSVLSKMNIIAGDLDTYLDSAQGATTMYNGISTVIAGLPNAGKSSLFNAILGYPRTIVHEDAGTTRDVVKEHILINGLDFILCDTAGIKEISTGPEQIGVEKTIEALKTSDLTLYIVDATRGIAQDEHKWLHLSPKTILVLNKIDLHTCDIPKIPDIDTVRISAKYNQGIDELLNVMAGSFPSGTPQVFIERHIYLLKKTRESIISSVNAIENGMTLDVITIDIRDALAYIREILGEDINADIMESIFSKFCIGK